MGPQGKPEKDGQDGEGRLTKEEFEALSPKEQCALAGEKAKKSEGKDKRALVWVCQHCEGNWKEWEAKDDDLEEGDLTEIRLKVQEHFDEEKREKAEGKPEKEDGEKPERGEKGGKPERDSDDDEDEEKPQRGERPEKEDGEKPERGEKPEGDEKPQKKKGGKGEGKPEKTEE